MVFSEIKMNNRYTFLGGKQGLWQVTRIDNLIGVGLETVERLDVINGEPDAINANWVLRGLTSNVRYATRVEVNALKQIQPTLNRPEALCAALIPIKKQRSGGICLRTSAEKFSRKHRTTTRSAWIICPLLPANSTTAATSANPSIFSLGSNLPLSILRLSKLCLSVYG
jgi:hypothetical protein